MTDKQNLEKEQHDQLSIKERLQNHFMVSAHPQKKYYGVEIKRNKDDDGPNLERTEAINLGLVESFGEYKKDPSWIKLYLPTKLDYNNTGVYFISTADFNK